MSSLFLSDPRKTRDPLLNRSANTRLLIDLLGEGIALSLASATASNYLPDQYGSLIRIIYEKCAQLLSELVIDLSDLSSDSENKNLRAEFMNLRLLSVLFREDEQLTYNDTEELQLRVNAVLDAIFKGSNEATVQEMLETFVGPAVRVNLEQVSEHSFDVALRSYNQTTTPLIDGVLQGSGHRHIIYVRGEGLESTGGPIGATWGQDLHYHEVYDGVVQPAYDQDGTLHTHELLSGLNPSIITLQKDIENALYSVKPAHVSLGDVTNITDEEIDAPSFGMSLSLGSSYQEDMRVAREGTYENEILAYLTGREARTWSTIFNTPDTLYSQETETSTERARHRVLSRQEVVLEDGSYEISLPRIKSRTGALPLTFSAQYQSSGGQINLPTVLIADGWVEELAWLEVQDGEPVLADGVCYFARRLRAPAYLNSDGLTCDLGSIVLEATVLSLDTKTQTDGLKYLENIDLPYRTRERRTRGFSWIMGSVGNVEDPITPDNFPEVLKRSFNAPVLGDLFTLYVNGTDAQDLIPINSTLVLRWYDMPTPHVRRGLSAYVVDQFGAVSGLVNQGDDLSVVYPFGVDQNTTFSALNHTSFKLNAHRYDRLKDSYAGRGRDEERASNSIPSHPQVLNRASKIEVGTYERREVSTSLLKTDTLNTKSVLGMGFTLNNSAISVSIDPSKVYRPASAQVLVRDGRINISDLGFYPERIISITDGSVYYSYSIRDGFIYLESAPDNETQVTVTSISIKPFTSSEEWFRNEEYAEGQVPFVNKAFAPYEDVPSIDDYMSNPEGRPLTNVSPDEARRYTGSVFTESRGSDGELVFAEDTWTGFTLGGEAYTERTPLLRDVAYSDLTEITATSHNTNPMYERSFSPCFICGGENGGTVYDTSVLNGLSILSETVEAQQIGFYIIP